MGVIGPNLGVCIIKHKKEKVGLSLGDALFPSATQRKVLTCLFIDPERRFYSNEIVNIVGMGKGTVERELKKLAGAGVLSVKVEGRQKYYQANRDAPIFSEIHGIVIKTFGISDQIKSALSKYQDSILISFIFGSIAKSTDTATSDIDLMVIADDLSYTSLMESLMGLDVILRRPINPTMYSKGEFSKKVAEGNHFLTRILDQEKIMIIGTEKDVQKLREPS